MALIPFDTICRSIATPMAGSLLREQQLPARFAPAVAERLDRKDAPTITS